MPDWTQCQLNTGSRSRANRLRRRSPSATPESFLNDNGNPWRLPRQVAYVTDAMNRAFPPTKNCSLYPNGETPTLLKAPREVIGVGIAQRKSQFLDAKISSDKPLTGLLDPEAVEEVYRGAARFQLEKEGKVRNREAGPAQLRGPATQLPGQTFRQK